LAIDRVCAEKFYKSLNNKERHFVKICIEVLCNHFYNSDARSKLKISRNEYGRLKRATYEKFIKAFGTDEDADVIDQQAMMGVNE
jgi:hypothetical protein